MTKSYITDQLHDFYQISLQYKKILHDEQSNFQHIRVVETDYFGRVLLLDGVIQLTEFDNAAYHEMIAHVPMLAHDDPRRVLIVGGGDGGTLQQVLRHESVRQVVVVELDRRVVAVCEQYFPSFGKPFADARVELVTADAFAYLADGKDKFDVIIADTTDPIGEASKLFSERFYALMVGALNEGGVIVTQCEHMFFDAALIGEMWEIAKGLVRHPAYYHALVPTYPGGGIGFLYLSDEPWQKGIGKDYPQNLVYLNREIHEGAFALPAFIRKQLH